MIHLEGLELCAGEFSLAGIDLEITEGEYVVLMGRTGCGKSTLLETLCGLLPAAAGRIILAGEDVTMASPAQRGVGYVPQAGVLFQTMRVRKNLGFALHLRGMDRHQQAARVAEIAEILAIGHLLDRWPNRLSGGERQRVALGRALAFRPRVLCLDEPLSALDDAIREEMYGVIDDLRSHTQVTTLHVTHNHADADRLADRVFVMNETGLQPVEKKCV